ncbi:MAG: Gldg family protein [Boseongicola sp.]|nr:Gldg family protein [Boseongicola sp.]
MRQALRNIGVVARKELMTYLGSPMAYIVTAVFLAISGAFFASFLAATSYANTSIAGFLNAAQLLILVFAALLTMRLVVEEKKQGTWELVMTTPVREAELIAGKFLGSLAILCGMLLLTLYFTLLLLIFGDPDLGPIATSYVGLVLIGSACLAVGIFASTVTGNQIVSAVMAGGILFGLWAIGVIADIVDGGIGEFLKRLSLSGYFADFERGIIDTQALIYYLSLTVFFLFAAVRAIEAGRWRLAQQKGRSRNLAFTGLGVLFVAWVLNFVLPSGPIITWAIVTVGVGLISANALVEFRQMRDALTSTRGTFGIGTGISLSLVTAVLLLANLISTNVFHRFDFTGLSQFTLTTQTKDFLTQLSKEQDKVEVVSFYSDSNPNIEGSAEAFAVNNFGYNLLLEYTNHTDVLDIRREDPELRPDLARQYLGQGQLAQIASSLGVVVFRGAEGQLLVLGPQIQAEAENAFTSAILQVTGTKQRVVYFLTGHGEPSIGGDFSSARAGLRDNLFQVGEWNFAQLDALPKNASAIVLAAPKVVLGEDKIALLNAYLNNGGRLLLLINPNQHPDLRRLLATWWMSSDDGVIVDPESHVTPNLDVPLVDARRNQFRLPDVYFPGATAIRLKADRPVSAQIQPLAWTTASAWQEKNALGVDDPVFETELDVGGTQAIGARLEMPVGEDVPQEKRLASTTRLAVIGDSDFASNQHIGNGSNRELFLRVINWLGEGDEVVSVDRKVVPVRRLVLGPEEARFLNLSAIGLMPLVLLVVAARLWWRRK